MPEEKEILERVVYEEDLKEISAMFMAACMTNSAMRITDFTDLACSCISGAEILLDELDRRKDEKRARIPR